MSRRSAEILLASLIIARATSYMFSKMLLETLEPLNLLALRFSIAFMVLAVIFGKRLLKMSLRDLAMGAILGVGFFAVMSFEMNALRYTDSSRVSFLENTAIVIVPIMEAALRRKAPNRKNMVSAVITLTGVGLLTMKGAGLGFGKGEILCVCAAVTYASVIIITDRFSHKGDPLVMGILQIGFMALLSAAGSVVFETPALPQTTQDWGAVMMLVIVCSCFGFTLQPLAQQYVSSETAGQFCALNPLTAAVLGVTILNEHFGIYGILGAFLIMAGIVIQNLHLHREGVKCK